MSEWTWELAILLSKFFAYISFVSLTGGLFLLLLGSRLRPANGVTSLASIEWSAAARRYLVNLLIFSSGFGKLAMLSFFFLQVGLINQNGMAGMFDGFMIVLLAKTPIGIGAALRLAGFALIGLVLIVYRVRLTSPQAPVLATNLLVFWSIGILLSCIGFAILGHVAVLGWFAQTIIGLHVLLIGMWVGALYPLYLLCRTEPASAIEPLLKRFGLYGWSFTLGLSAAGVYLLTRLMEAPSELFTSDYGRLLLVKMVLVLCLLALAALNKFRLVPALQVAGAAPLRRSIGAEMALALLILVATAVLTTITGPASHMG